VERERTFSTEEDELRWAGLARAVFLSRLNEWARKLDGSLAVAGPGLT
jgi:hypothetical protein